MGMSFYGVTMTPPDMCAYLSGSNTSHSFFWASSSASARDGEGVVLSTFYYRLSSGATVRLNQTSGYDTIANDLRTGNPVMLCVPALIGIDPGTERHYILAYGLSPSAPTTGSVDPSQIYIYDPANNTSSPLSLATYFQMVDGQVARPPHIGQVSSPINFGTTNARDWFNSGTYMSNGSTLELSSTVAPLVDEFMTNTGQSPATLTVHSPVDLVITDPSTGKRYVSSASLASSGDTVLSKDYLDCPDDISATLPLPLSNPFPVYSLLLPDELYGESLDVSVVGIGSGSYEVDYQSSDPNVLASPALSGTISTGQTIPGQFTVTVVPEPSALVLLSACAVSFLILRKRKRV